MKRVLITGATGFIGRHLVPQLLERGYEVHGIGLRRASDPPRQTIDWWRGQPL
ncbi:MAG: GDP-mannose 4,6-dehydratase [Elusimicrobia bacterium]|nr:GDP-mannose 4,6-dehydratase [Elusimicrobiota bacterium]